MARLLTSGFELNSLTAGVEFKAAGGNVMTIDTGTVRTGTYSLKNAVSASFSWMNFQVKSSATNTQLFVRVYVRFASLPAGVSELFSVADTTGAVGSAFVRYNNTGTKFDIVDAVGTNLGSSVAISTNTWYRLEVDVTGSTTVGALKGYLDGTQFATTTTGNIPSFDGIYLGNAFNSGTYTAFFDDMAINDSSGTKQNALPGAGQVVYLRPSAAGDNNDFTVQIGGTAGASNNFTRVKEVTPDDVTSYNGDVTATDTDDFNIDDTPSSIGASDTINVVHVGVRYRALVAAAEAAFKVRTKKASGGTVDSSAAITPNSTTWKTNANAEPRLYPTTLYADPDAAAWTKATLDTAQIGYNISTTNTNAADISTIWMVVDSTPVSVVVDPFSGTKFMQLLGVGT